MNKQERKNHVDHAWQDILIKNYAILRELKAHGNAHFFQQLIGELGPWEWKFGWRPLINYNVKEPKPTWIWWKIIWRNESQHKMSKFSCLALWLLLLFVSSFFVHLKRSRDKSGGGYKMRVRASDADSICWCHLSLCWLLTGLKDSKSRKMWCDSNVYDFIFILLFLYYRLLPMLLFLLCCYAAICHCWWVLFFSRAFVHHHCCSRHSHFYTICFLLSLPLLLCSCTAHLSSHILRCSLNNIRY